MHGTPLWDATAWRRGSDANETVPLPTATARAAGPRLRIVVLAEGLQLPQGALDGARERGVCLGGIVHIDAAARCVPVARAVQQAHAAGMPPYEVVDESDARERAVRRRDESHLREALDERRDTVCTREQGCALHGIAKQGSSFCKRERTCR